MSNIVLDSLVTFPKKIIFKYTAGQQQWFYFTSIYMHFEIKIQVYSLTKMSATNVNYAHNTFRCKCDKRMFLSTDVIKYKLDLVAVPC